MENKVKKITKSAEETQKFGKEIGERIHAGGILALYGDLGSGKTTFVQGLAKGLGITQRIISPTFIIMRTYSIKGKEKFFYHIDLYRTKTSHDIEALGLEEIMSDTNNIVVIEWPDRLGKLLPKNVSKIHFRYLLDESREILYD